MLSLSGFFNLTLSLDSNVDCLNSTASARRSLQFATEAARMEPPPFLRDENRGIGLADDVEMLTEEPGNERSGPSETTSPNGRQHYHSDNVKY